MSIQANRDPNTLAALRDSGGTGWAFASSNQAQQDAAFEPLESSTDQRRKLVLFVDQRFGTHQGLRQ